MSLLNILLMPSIVLVLLWFWKWILKVVKGLETRDEEWTEKYFKVGENGFWDCLMRDIKSK